MHDMRKKKAQIQKIFSEGSNLRLGGVRPLQNPISGKIEVRSGPPAPSLGLRMHDMLESVIVTLLRKPNFT